MGLIKESDLSIIQQHAPVNNAVSYKSILPDLEYAEELYIKKAMGDDQYENLLQKYELDTIVADSDDEKLLKVCQVALVNLAYGIYTVIGQVTIDNSGVRIQTGDEYKTAFEWQVKDIQNNYFFRKGDHYLDEVLSFMEENKDSFALWKASTAYTVTKELLINTASEFNELYGINGSRRTFMAFKPIMRKEEYFKIKPALGSDFYDEIKAEILSDAGVGADTAELMPMLTAALAHFTIAKACVELSVEVMANAVVVNESFSAGNVANVKKTADAQLLKHKVDGAIADANAYMQKVKEHLDAEASDSKYATYFTSDLYSDPAADKSSYLKNDEDGGIFPAFG